MSDRRIIQAGFFADHRPVSHRSVPASGNVVIQGSVPETGIPVTLVIDQRPISNCGVSFAFCVLFHRVGPDRCIQASLCIRFQCFEPNRGVVQPRIVHFQGPGTNSRISPCLGDLGHANTIGIQGRISHRNKAKPVCVVLQGPAANCNIPLVCQIVIVPGKFPDENRASGILWFKTARIHLPPFNAFNMKPDLVFI